MATFGSYAQDAATLGLYATDNYSGSDADLDNTDPVDEADGFTESINGTSRPWVSLEFTFLPNNSTDDLIIKKYRSLLGNWTGKEPEYDRFDIANINAEDKFQDEILPADGPWHWRYSMQSAGGATTYDMKVEAKQTRTQLTAA